MCSNMPAFLFIDKDTTRSTCSAKAEVLKFLLWVSDDQTSTLQGDERPTTARAASLIPDILCAVRSAAVLFVRFQMYESPVVASLAESGNIALPPAMYLKQTGLLDQMRREILCEGASLVEADSTSASIRGNAMVASSVNLMTQLYGQIDLSTLTQPRALACCSGGTAAAASAAAHCSCLCLTLLFTWACVLSFLSLLVLIQADV